MTYSAKYMKEVEQIAKKINLFAIEKIAEILVKIKKNWGANFFSWSWRERR